MVFEIILFIFIFLFVTVNFFYSFNITWLWYWFLLLVGTLFLMINTAGTYWVIYWPCSSASSFFRRYYPHSQSLATSDYLDNLWFNGGVLKNDLVLIVLMSLFFCYGCATLARAWNTTYEYVLLLLISSGACVLSFSTDHGVVLYLLLEIQALTLYTLVGYHRFSESSTGAALKYLLTGSFASGFTLLGFLSFYQLEGTFQLHELSQTSFYWGSTWLVGSLLFKLGVYPFCFWVPQVYRSLDFATLGFFLTAAKVNIWFLLAKTLACVLPNFYWVLLIGSLMSLLIGSVGGLFQRSISSLLSYSSILNSGYLVLILIFSKHHDYADNLFLFSLYLVNYSLVTLLLVYSAALLSESSTQKFRFVLASGTSFSFLLYYAALNLAGLPAYPGFFAKILYLRVFLGVSVVLMGIVVLFSVLAAFYYVRMSVTPFFSNPRRNGYFASRVRPVSPFLSFVVYFVINSFFLMLLNLWW